MKPSKITLSGIMSFISLFVLALSVPSFGSINYTGSLSLSGPPSYDGYLTGTGDWYDVGPTTLNWSVQWNGTEQYAHYSYTLSVPDHSPSYFILELPDSLSAADIINVSGDVSSYQVGTFTPNRANSGGQYQTMPESVYGVKFDLTENNTVNIAFDSTRLPEWGDFYSRCGITVEHEDGTKAWNSAWNTGFTNPDANDLTRDDSDPLVAASSGSVNSHLLTPGTVVTPEPVSSVLFITGGAVFVGRRLMKRKK